MDQAALLAIWQEASRQRDIAAATAAIAPLLARRVPFAALCVRRCEPGRGLLTVAEHPPARGGEPRTPLAPAELRALERWGAAGEVQERGPRARGRPWCPAVPEDLPGPVLVGPLRSSGGALEGVLLLAPRPGQPFSARQRALARELLGPFSAALEHHDRLEQLAHLRAAAEADRSSLLARLGRTELGEHHIVGAEAGLRPVLARVSLVARADAPVLILGETGSGKEVVARAIHGRSPRAAGPFVRVNCGAIPLELVDSHLFGHERGSFTGATAARRGWFERADGGTLFLDEVAELPPAAQVRLLRVLQDGWLERVGGEEPLRVDVRVVAATHRDLPALVRERRFREDLWYRLAVFPVLLPPLRERAEDIPALARHFAERAATRFGLHPCEPGPTDLALLAAYPWPGNVRELAAVIDRAALLGDGQRLDVATALGGPHAAPLPAPGPGAPPGPARALPSLEEVVRAHIEAALRAAAGRIEGRRGAAALLRLNPHTLRARMRKLGIEWARFREPAG